jgi:hypothetical protein
LVKFSVPSVIALLVIEVSSFAVLI